MEGEGMRDYRHHDLKGNLYFVFDVEFPENGFLDETKLQVISNPLPFSPSVLSILAC